MLIYSKKNADGALRLFGTVENVPADDDKELVYKDESGAEVELADGDSYVTFSEGGIQNVRRLSDGKELSVFIVSADGAETLVIGPEVEAAESTGEEESDGSSDSSEDEAIEDAEAAANAVAE